MARAAAVAASSSRRVSDNDASDITILLGLEVTSLLVLAGASDAALPQRLERGAQLRREQFRVLPRREVTTLVDFMEVDQVAKGAPGP
jgi:hypothetical protein